ncbi:MAG: YcaO-like family protein [Spirochaetota bacterium]
MYHYKDNHPIDTVTQIRQILKQLGILPVETWKNSIEGLYSLKLRIAGVNPRIGTGGKGRNELLSLASAYGELIERLQNQILYPIFFYYNFDSELKKYAGFCYDPGEAEMGVDELFSRIPERILQNYNLPVLKKALISPISNFLKTDDGTFICVPCYALNAGTELLFPSSFIYYFYGSNGMCAGNTIEEALVQGISEIIERYTIRTIILNNINPPVIDRKLLSACFPEEFEIIKRIEGLGDYTVIIKDCSLGEGWPVMAVVFIDKKRNGYFVKFGAHPDLRIALERALLELFQLRDIKNFTDLIPFEVLQDEALCRSVRNLHSIYHNGAGMYPVRFFEDDFSYAVTLKIFNRRFSSNKECLHYLLLLVKRSKWDVLIRDVSFLEFPSFHVIIPGVSELNCFTADDYSYLQTRLDISQKIKSIPEISEDDLCRIIEFLKREYANSTGSYLSEIINLPLSPQFVWSKIDYHSFMAIGCHKVGELQNAKAHIQKGLEHIEQQESTNPDLIPYYKCTRDYFGLIQRNYNADTVKSLLGKIYQGGIVNKVIADFAKPGKLIDQLGRLNCPYCPDCPAKSYCTYDEVRKIHKNIKNMLKQNPVCQMKIKKTIDTYW